MVKIRNVYGDEYKGRQGNAVYQKFYGRQIRRLWDGKKENRAPQQEEQKKRFKMGLAFWESLSTEEREKLKEYLRGIGSDLTAQQWAVKVALSRPRVTVQQEEVLANLVEWVQGWDAIGWPYRQKITLTNDLSTDLVGYQKLLELDSTKVGAHFDWSRQGADLRFYDSDGNKLKYWVESWDEQNKQAKVWVRVSQIPAQGSTSIKMYYGNANAQSESDGESVFEFFDDFDGTELDTGKWTIDDEASATREIISSSEATHGNLLHIVASSSGRAFQYSKTSFEDNKHVLEVRIKSPDEKTRVVFDTQDKDNHYLYHHAPDAGIYVLYKRVSGSYSGIVKTSVAYDNNWEVVRVYRDSSGVIHLVANDVELATSSDTTYSSGYVGVSVGNGKECYVDWVRVRKYAEQEPSATFGSEEVGQEVTHTTTRVTVKAIEHVAIADVRVFDEQGNEIWRAEGLTNIMEGKIATRVRLPDEVVKEGVRALVRSAAGTVDIVNL